MPTKNAPRIPRLWRRLNRPPCPRREELLVHYLLRCPDFRGRFFVNSGTRVVRFCPGVPHPLAQTATETTLDVLLAAAHKGGHDAARRLCWRLLEAVAEPPAGR